MRFGVYDHSVCVILVIFQTCNDFIAFAKIQSGIGCINFLHFPKTIKEIHENAFSECSSLNEIECDWSNIDKIGEYTFSCTGIKKIDLSDFCREINGLAFDNSKLEDVILGDYIRYIH